MRATGGRWLNRLAGACLLTLVGALLAGSIAIAQNNQGGQDPLDALFKRPVVMLYAPARVTPNNLTTLFAAFPYAFAGTGVAVSRSSVLTVWHVAELEGLVLRTGCCKDYPSPLPGSPPESGPIVERVALTCPAPVSILSVAGSSVPPPTARLAFREVTVGEPVTAAGYPNGEWMSLGLQVESYGTYAMGREVLRYMVLAPRDFEYFPPRLGGMSGSPVFDSTGAIVGLISLQIQGGALHQDRIAAVPLGVGLGRCRNRLGQ